MYTIIRKGPSWHIQTKNVSLCIILCFLEHWDRTLQKISSWVVFKIFFSIDVAYYTTEILTPCHGIYPSMYTSIFNRASVMKILHSKRMPLFLCISWSKGYLASHWSHHYVTLFWYLLISSHILEPWSHYLFNIVMSMDMPASSIYMSHILCISPIYGNQH